MNDSDRLSGLPRQLYCAESVREMDRRAIEEFGIPGFALMRRAGCAALALLQTQWPAARRLAVFCGAGNNGGDGYVLAAEARQCGLDVVLFAIAPVERLHGDARQAHELACAAGVSPIAWAGELPGEVDVIVDAVLGTGLRGEVRPETACVIAAINEAAAPVLSIDIPSGLCSDTGAVLGCAVRARHTLSFIGLKLGLFAAEGPERAGEVHFDDLSAPTEILRSAPPACERLDWATAAAQLPPRRRSAHKGSFGHVLIVGGELGMGGAGILAAGAAARVGAGLVSLATRPEHVPAVLARVPEVMAHGVASGQDLEPLLPRASVVVVGPGLGRNPWGEQLLRCCWLADKPLVVDADALQLLKLERIVGDARRDNWIITPHPGEAAALLDSDVAGVQRDRIGAVTALQGRHGAVAILKGVGTLVADGDATIGLCPYGNPGMATGGMGDVLTGVIAALLAQHHAPGDAARLGVLLHARAADIAARRGERGMLASDLLPILRGLVNPDRPVAGIDR